MKFTGGDKVKFEELGRDFQGEVVVGIIDDFSGDEAYLVQVGGRQVMKDSDELEKAE